MAGVDVCGGLDEVQAAEIVRDGTEGKEGQEGMWVWNWNCGWRILSCTTHGASLVACWRDELTPNSSPQQSRQDLLGQGQY